MSAVTDVGGWGPLLDELRRRQEAARAMGGPERLERQHAKGKLDARQRLDRLFDEGTFTELGTLVGTLDDIPGDALVAGMGLVDGRPTLAAAEDFTVKGGSIGVGNTDKRFRLTQIAERERLPLVLMLDGAGHRLTLSTGGLTLWVYTLDDPTRAAALVGLGVEGIVTDLPDVISERLDLLR